MGSLEDDNEPAYVILTPFNIFVYFCVLQIYEIHMVRWYDSVELCKALYFLYWMSFMVSVFTLTAMALER